MRLRKLQAEQEVDFRPRYGTPWYIDRLENVKVEIFTLSTTKAEFLLTSDLYKEIVWVRHLLKELEADVTSRTILFEDNQCATRWALEGVRNARHTSIPRKCLFVGLFISVKAGVVVFPQFFLSLSLSLNFSLHLLSPFHFSSLFILPTSTCPSLITRQVEAHPHYVDNYSGHHNSKSIFTVDMIWGLTMMKHLQLGILKLVYCPSENTTVESFTKKLLRMALEHHCTGLDL